MSGLVSLPASGAIGAGLLAGACAPANQKATTSLRVDYPVTVTLMVPNAFAGPGADAVREAFDTMLRPQQPNITVDFQAAGVGGASYTAALVAANVAGTPPDVFYQGLAAMPAAVEKGIVGPLDDLIKADKTFKADDVFPVHWKAWSFRGKQQGLPWQGGPLVSYYNQNLFDAAGAAPPTEANWTWEALRQTGAKLKRTMAATGGDLRWPTDVGPWLHWLYAAGADVLDTTMARCILDSPQALNGLQTMTDVIHRDQIAPAPQEKGNQAPKDLFMAARLASIIMNRQGSAAAGFVQPWVKIAVLPKGPAGRFSLCPFDGFSLGAGINARVAAWEVLKFRTGDPLRRLIHGRGLGGIPALKSTAASQEYLMERLPPEWNQFFVDNMATVRLPPPTPHWPDAQSMVEKSVSQMLRGEAAPATALRDLVPQVNALLQAA